MLRVTRRYLKDFVNAGDPIDEVMRETFKNQGMAGFEFSKSVTPRTVKIVIGYLFADDKDEIKQYFLMLTDSLRMYKGEE